MKKLVLLFSLGLIFCACNESFNVEPDATLLQKEMKGVSSVEICHYFDSITNPAVWKTFNTLEEMQEACQIPVDVLEKMSTKELAQICLSYPLAGNYLAYNDELRGVSAVIDGFNGFSELFRREDAADELLTLYEQMDLDAMAAMAKKNVNTSKVTYYNSTIRLGYLELILASGRLKALYEPSNISRLNVIKKYQYEKKLRNPGLFGRKSLKRSFILESSFNQSELEYRKLPSQFMESVVSSDKDAVNFLTTTIETKCGKLVEVLSLPEMSPEEISEVNENYSTTYPNAVRIGDASNRYNCHSYAWNMRDGGSTCWINSTKSSVSGNVPNLALYWTTDFYVSATQERETYKVFYPMSDHSAVVSSVSGMYESKWGAAPLMRHSPTYGPYQNMNVRKYYCRRSLKNGVLSCSNGVGETLVGVRSVYSAEIDPNDMPTGSKVRKQWVIYDAKGDEALDSKAIVESIGYGGTSATIYFTQTGMYDIYFIVDVPTGEKFYDYYFQALVVSL